ncbi:MAG: hypothetical protein OXS30_06755 [Chloroflexota bacterium]|nr:hypothetical protein [Chloroflexota bacterium]
MANHTEHAAIERNRQLRQAVTDAVRDLCRSLDVRRSGVDEAVVEGVAQYLREREPTAAGRRQVLDEFVLNVQTTARDVDLE